MSEQQPHYATNAVRSTDYPGKTMGIVAMILSLANLIALPTALIGAILGHVALSQSKAAGYSNTPAIVGIAVGWAITALYLFLLILIFSIAGFGSALSY